ncbi:MAG: bifunctional demethylmenaquinone methyltransferase/2-methoxy-6-polyprenyl-1,4-benzoquinol methylase UbiE [Gammaproteobacteria bacterium]
MTDRKADFGFQSVSPEEKVRRVKQVFDSVAHRYDVMNDLMSLGMHRIWKRFTTEVSGVRPGQRVLDLAGGTGDLTRQFATRVGATGTVVLADINATMLEHGRSRLVDAGIVDNVAFLQADAEELPFREAAFDCVCMAFGLRNVTDKVRALASIYRVLRPGGKLLVLEFSTPTLPLLRPFYDVYSFTVLPWLGRVVAKDSESYRYLAESIRMHPDQETLKAMMESAGFEQCSYLNLTAGVVALHQGYKL